jgi:hypothetical protein
MRNLSTFPSFSNFPQNILDRKLKNFYICIRGHKKEVNMKNIPKLTILSLALNFFVSCGLSDKCKVEERYFNNKVQFGNYYGKKYYFKDSSQYTITQFSFYEDSNFSYLKIFHQYDTEGMPIQDTVTMLNGEFKIYRDSGYPWYILKLNADSIYEKKIMDTLEGTWVKFQGFRDSVFSNTDSKGNYKLEFMDSTDIERCFTLFSKYAPNSFPFSDTPSDCDYTDKNNWDWYLENYRLFCLEEKLEAVSKQTSTGDSL